MGFSELLKFGNMSRLLLRATNSSVVIHSGRLRFDMSIIQRLLGHGRALLRYHFQGIYNKNLILGKLDPINLNVGKLTVSVGQVLPSKAHSAGPFEWIGKGIQAHVRRIFVNNVLQRLHQRTSQQFLYANNSRPFLAFVGLSLASGAGVLAKENEFEGICLEIRELCHLMWMGEVTPEESFEKKQRQFDYLKKLDASVKEMKESISVEPVSVKQLEFGPLIAQGSSAAVYAARWKSEDQKMTEKSYPLGVKMMFNFYCESNSAMIIRAMCKEIVPARNIERLRDICVTDLDRLHRCPTHPNIIEILDVFTDQVPLLSESLDKYPDALPRRLNEDGLGRNMSLFLVMKRYDTSLQEYLQQHSNLKLKNRVLILTQLLEGVVHLNANEIAHRDLKADNILLQVSSDAEFPHLVITDFGCCLADKAHGLNLPFPSGETDRGGNAALMAPEISSAIPGSWSRISYKKSDVWSVGAIAFEIFGENNPFIQGRVGIGHTLDSRRYDEAKLPVISSVPPLINDLVHSLLKRNPSERLSAEVAATICHIYLWGPTRWLIQRIPDSEIIQWILTLTTKLLWQTPSDALKVEFTIIRTFLTRLRFSIVRVALDWIHDHQATSPILTHKFPLHILTD